MRITIFHFSDSHWKSRPIRTDKLYFGYLISALERTVLLNRQERQTQHPDWSAPDQIQRKKPETPVKPTRIRLNYEPDARKSAH
jgi:hypothetical protein